MTACKGERLLIVAGFGPNDTALRRLGRTVRRESAGLSLEPTVQAILQRIVDVGAQSIEGCDGAGVLLLHKREIVAGSWSNDLVRKIETME